MGAEAAVTLGESRLKAPRTEFVVETYTPSEPLLFVPSRVKGRSDGIATMWSSC